MMMISVCMVQKKHFSYIFTDLPVTPQEAGVIERLDCVLYVELLSLFDLEDAILFFLMSPFYGCTFRLILQVHIACMLCV